MKSLFRQIPGVKGLVLGLPWDEQTFSGSGLAMKAPDGYGKIPLIYRAVNIRANSLARVPVSVYRGEDEAQWPYEDTMSLHDLLWLCEASLMVCGASYDVRLRNTRREMGLRWLNPTTMSVRELSDGTLSFTQQVGGKTKTWPEEEIFYLRNFSLDDDIGPGVAQADLALTGGRTLQGVSRFAAQFFESGAMPVTILGLPFNTKPDQVEKTEDMFKKLMRGVRNAFRIKAVSGQVDVKQITPNLNTLDLSGLDVHAINDVAWAFDTPKTLLTADSANFATAETEYRNFLLQTIGARCNYFESAVSRLLEPLGLSIDFDLQELPELQQDEAERATAFKTYVDAGMSKQLAAAMLGLEIPDDFQDFWTEEDEPPTVVVQPAPDQQVVDDMRRWKHKASKRLREGKSAQVEFVSKAIPQQRRALIYEALGKARTQAEVYSIFNGGLK